MFIIANTINGLGIVIGFIAMQNFMIETITCLLFISLGIAFINFVLNCAHDLNSTSGQTQTLIRKLYKISSNWMQNIEFKVNSNFHSKEFLKTINSELISFKFYYKLIFYTIFLIVIILLIRRFSGPY